MKEWKFKYSSTADQDVYFTIDYERSRKFPGGCKIPKQGYKMVNGNNDYGIEVNPATSYGLLWGYTWAGDSTILHIHNTGDSNVEPNFVLTAYGEKGKVTLEETK